MPSAPDTGRPDEVIPLTGLWFGLVLVPFWWILAGLIGVTFGVGSTVTLVILAAAVLIQLDARRQVLRHNPDAREMTLGDIVHRLRGGRS